MALAYVVVAIVVVLLLVFCKLDCDWTLLWNIYFGRKPAVLSGKVVWITGCSSGIGEALAHQFAKAGCTLVLSARREPLLQQVKQKCLEISDGKLKSDDILVQPLDMLDFDSHPEIVKKVLNYFKQVDVLINNAGRSQRGLIVDTMLKVDRQVIDLDFLAPISLTKAVLPSMIDRGQGHIVCTSSVAGKYGAPGSATYAGAKHGIQGFFDTLRIEMAPHNITVTMACPGPVFSEALVEAFTPNPGEKLNISMDNGWDRMKATRCAYLMAVGVANGLHELWVSSQPELFYCYLFQYLPYIAKHLALTLGQNRVNKVKAGVGNLH